MCCCTNLRISNPSSLLWKIATREAEWSCTYVLSLYFAGMCNIDGGCIFQNKAKDDDLPNCTLVHFDKISSTWMHCHQTRFYTNRPLLLLSDNKETLWQERKVATWVFCFKFKHHILLFFIKLNTILHYTTISFNFILCIQACVASSGTGSSGTGSGSGTGSSGTGSGYLFDQRMFTECLLTESADSLPHPCMLSQLNTQVWVDHISVYYFLARPFLTR